MKRPSDKVAARIGIGVMITVAAACGWAAFVEPRWLEVTEHSVTLPVRAPLLIAHVSDLHTNGAGPLEDAVLAALGAAKPDLIVITGDLYDKESARAGASAFIDRMDAPLGVYFAPGNWEHWVGLPKATPWIAGTRVRTLDNAAARVREDLWLVGFDDAFAGKPDAARALAGVPTDVAVIGMFHAPRFFDEVATRVDLALAGHTHGGQVRVPGLGAPWVPPGTGRYVRGWYERCLLYTSRCV